MMLYFSAVYLQCQALLAMARRTSSMIKADSYDVGFDFNLES
jgi:hypothetical protein